MIQGLDLSRNASSIKYFVYLHIYTAASHLAIRSQTNTDVTFNLVRHWPCPICHSL